MDAQKIREIFVDFFAERRHTVVPSSSLVPDDPTLLLTNAGMNQFKPYFLGEKPAPYKRAVSIQKVMRAGGKDSDVELVGKTRRHFSLWEMLGNFSFGDYFKEGAIEFAWELVTKGYGLDPERLWISVYLTDDEAADIWEKQIGVPQHKILRRGKEHGNYWTMGVAGPAGPCSELMYDCGESFGRAYVAGEELDEERYLEFWNLVFMQDAIDDAGNKIGDLPQKNIDTGLGLERLAAILQDAPTAIDTMGPLVRAAAEITGRPYGSDQKTDVSARVMAEHARTISFLIGDGVLPSNEGRGYVLRRLIRRAIRYARLAGVEEPFLTKLIDPVVELFGKQYPEVERARELVTRVVSKEEERFSETLRQGFGMLELEISQAKNEERSQLSGKVAFKLHDTYGFPLDLTVEIAEEEGLTVDADEFNRNMNEQRERARSARKTVVAASSVEAASETEFLGYEHLQSDATVVAVEEVGERTQIVLDRTTFYAESGGQVGDRGEITTATGRFQVEDTQHASNGVIAHVGKTTAGDIQPGQEAKTRVDPPHREGVTQSHTATHMLHWGLRDFLGEHVHQQGSLVEPGRLRFDFSHYEAVSEEKLAELEEEINRRVLFDDSVRAYETSFDYAKSIGAMALFGEKYGDIVRVVEVGDYSKELCGGTHVFRTGRVGVVTLVSEGSVAAGTRRIEAYTGLQGLRYLNAQIEKLRRVAEILKTDPESVVDILEKRESAYRSMQAELAKQRNASRDEEIQAILASESVKPLGDSKLIKLRRDGESVSDLREMAEGLARGVGSGIVVIGGTNDGKANIVAAATKDLIDRGISAGDLVKEGAGVLGGSGGGGPHLATGGGSNSSALDNALARVEVLVREALETTS